MRGRPAWLWILLVIAGVGLVPVVMTDAFFLRLFTEALMWIGLAITWDIMAGYIGYLNFGHGVFFGVGAYTTALFIVKAGVPFGPAVALGGVAAGLTALVIGWPPCACEGHTSPSAPGP